MLMFIQQLQYLYENQVWLVFFEHVVQILFIVFRVEGQLMNKHKVWTVCGQVIIND